jgi:hypothetical protein
MKDDADVIAWFARSQALTVVPERELLKVAPNEPRLPSKRVH